MVHWYPEMTRVIFDCIDEQKGESSRFITNENEALEDVRLRLEPKTHDKEVYATINKQQIKNKLIRQAEAGGISAGNIRSLYLYGVHILKVESMQKGVFDQAEIAPTKGKRVTSTKLLGAPQKRKSEDELSSTPKRLRLSPAATTAEERERPGANKRKATDGFEHELAPAKKVRTDRLANGRFGTRIQTQTTTQLSKLADSRCLSCQQEDLQCNFKKPCSRCKAKHTACRYPSTSTHADESAKRSVGAADAASRTTHIERSNSSEIDDVQSNSEEDVYHGSTTEVTRKEAEPFPRPQNSNSRQPILFTCEICEESFENKNEILQHKQNFHRNGQYPQIIACNKPDCFAFFTSSDDLKLHRKAHEELEDLQLRQSLDSEANKSKELRDWICLMKFVQPNEKETELIRLLKHDQAARHFEVESIQERMQDIQRRIYTYTLDYYFSCDIQNYRDKPTIDLTSYELSLFNLFETIYGPGRVDDPHDFKAEIEKPGQELQVLELVAALIGAAVTNWALRPLPQGKICNKSLAAKYLSLLGTKSKALQSILLQNATHVYLRDQVKPVLGKYAHSMATEMLHLLRHFIPFESQKTRKLWPEQIQAEATTDSTYSDGEDTLPSVSPHGLSPSSTNVTIQYPPNPPDDPKQVYLEGLAKDVFEYALNLRVDMEMKGNAEYRFFFPFSGAALDFKQHIAQCKANNRVFPDYELCTEAGIPYDYENREDHQTPARSIIVGLTPVVEGRFKDAHDGPWREEWETVCKSRVHLWRPNEERDLAAQPEEDCNNVDSD